MSGRRPAVFLDRDGVLNRAFVEQGIPVPPRRLEDFELLPGVEDACHELARAGVALVVVTNQPDVARGTLAAADLAAMHALMRTRLPLDDVLICLHDRGDGCWCRKPLPGMVLDAARRLDLDLDRSVMVGDRWRDVECAARAGVRSVLIDWGHAEAVHDPPDARFPSLQEARDYVLGCCTGRQKTAPDASDLETRP